MGLAGGRALPHGPHRAEVTQRDYAGFLAIGGRQKQLLHAANEPTWCKYDYKLVPDAHCCVGFASQCTTDQHDPVLLAEVPMNCVDPRAAMAFCTRAGKRVWRDRVPGVTGPDDWNAVGLGESVLRRVASANYRLSEASAA